MVTFGMVVVGCVFDNSIPASMGLTINDELLCQYFSGNAFPYRAPQKYGTLHVTFALRVADQEIVSTKILVTFIDHEKGPGPFERSKIEGTSSCTL